MTNSPAPKTEVEVICAHCGYHMARTAERLIRQTELICPNCGGVIVPEGQDRVEQQDNK
jgi:ribosomal protein S27AE